MRRTRPIAAAVLGAVVALLAVIAFPGLGIGQTVSSHGGTPSDVFMSTDAGVCHGEDPVGTEPASLMPTTVDVAQESAGLLVYFTTTASGWALDTALVLHLQVEGGEFFMESPEWISHGGSPKNPHTTLTVMWSFPDVPSGQYTVQATANLVAFQGTVGSGDGTNLQSCALSVFVMPAE